MSRCRICTSLAVGDTPALMVALRAARAGGAELAEVRLDALEDPAGLSTAELESLVSGSPLPLVFTCRPVWQGGGYAGEEDTRRALLEGAATAGAAFIDVEGEASWAGEFVKWCPVPVILSHHWKEPVRSWKEPVRADLGNDPVLSDLAARAAAMRGMGPAVVKLVAPAESPGDVMPLLQIGRELVESGQPAAAFCTGVYGRCSRVLVAAYGGALTYAVSPPADPTAPGQWPVADLVQEIRLPRWRRGFELCGLLGHPIEHSLSPAIFNAAFEAAGLDFGYVPIASAELEPAIELAESQGFRGLSVTMPFKEEAARRCASLSEEARRIGAVNTLVAGPDGWHGVNTDASAAAETLADLLDLDGATVTILGAGGAARAAAVALSLAGSRVEVLNRHGARAAEVASLVGGESGPLERLAEGRRDALINATPVGMGDPSSSPAPAEWLSGDEIVMDMVYRPPDTALLKAARSRGCRTVSGLEMFLRQAAAQFRLWTGAAAPAAELRRAAERGLEAS